MLETLAQKESLYAAFRRVKANKGCPGIDGKTIQAYEQNLARHLGELERLLKDNRYHPLPVKRVLIPKPNGKTRPLGIPTVSANCTRSQFAFGMGGDPPSVPSA